MARFKRHNRKRHVFGKRKENAIKAIARGPIETKKYYNVVTPYQSSITTHPDYARFFNIFANIPKDQGAADSEENVIGNKFDCRGVKVLIQTNTAAEYEVIFRATVVSCNDYIYTPPNTGNAKLATDPYFPFYEQDGITVAQPTGMFLPRRRYNTQSVNVLASKVWSMQKQYSTQGGVESFKEMWVPINGIKTSKAEEEVDSSVAELKGKQYYLIVEQYIASDTAPYIVASTSTRVTWVVYWKDP